MPAPSRLLTVVLVTSLFLALACDSDGEPVSPPTATTVGAGSVPTTVPAATAPPAPATPDPRFTPAFRVFARAVNTALTNRDIAFFRTRAQTVPVVCTAANTPARGLGGPDCQTVGQQFDGFNVGNWRSEGAIVSVDTALQTISRLWNDAVPGASDKYGASTPTVYAIGTDAGDTAKRSYTTVLTAMIQRPADFAGSGPLRVSLVLTWVPQDDDFGFVYLLSAFVLGEEWLDRAPATTGRMPVWERFPP